MVAGSRKSFPRSFPMGFPQLDQGRFCFLNCSAPTIRFLLVRLLERPAFPSLSRRPGLGWRGEAVGGQKSRSCRSPGRGGVSRRGGHGGPGRERGSGWPHLGAAERPEPRCRASRTGGAAPAAAQGKQPRSVRREPDGGAVRGVQTDRHQEAGGPDPEERARREGRGEEGEASEAKEGKRRSGRPSPLPRAGFGASAGRGCAARGGPSRPRPVVLPPEMRDSEDARCRIDLSSARDLSISRARTS